METFDSYFRAQLFQQVCQILLCHDQFYILYLIKDILALYKACIGIFFMLFARFSFQCIIYLILCNYAKCYLSEMHIYGIYNFCSSTKTNVIHILSRLHTMMYPIVISLVIVMYISRETIWHTFALRHE